jgi:hypothetical protein
MAIFSYHETVGKIISAYQRFGFRLQADLAQPLSSEYNRKHEASKRIRGGSLPDENMQDYLLRCMKLQAESCRFGR